MSEEATTVDDIRYLLFRLGAVFYATPLLGVREVVEAQDAKPVPGTSDCFNGVINIRGQVVGVVDLRKRFNHAATSNHEMALMVFETGSGLLAALVDQAEAVVHIPAAKIERRSNIVAPVDPEHILGVGQHQGKLITIIDVAKVLERQELRSDGGFEPCQLHT